MKKRVVFTHICSVTKQREQTEPSYSGLGLSSSPSLTLFLGLQTLQITLPFLYCQTNSQQSTEITRVSLESVIATENPILAMFEQENWSPSNLLMTLAFIKCEGMSGQVPTSNDRSRTYWTPTMERFFIDLMLEHMNRGNRIGHTFNKQAWIDMLSVFNAKFGSQYDKDVLKSRYTNLWKQFNDVKDLLGQSGFSWDETRQMVVADDHVWNTYIKVHPDARSYKTKVVLNFNDLCIIYGYTVADGRYSRSSHDVDFDEEFQGTSTGVLGSIASSNNDQQKTDWTTAMDQYFIELMIDQIGKGNKADSTFSKQAWTDMLAFFNAKFGSRHGKRVLRHRYKKLAKYYSDMTVLLNEHGFSWDETLQMIVAEDDVWDAYAKSYPHARAYRTKTFPNYNDLVLIFGDETDNGVCSNSHPVKDRDSIQKKAGEKKRSQTPANSDRTRTYWTPPMDRHLIDLLLDQVNRGNKIGQTFITQAWISMVASFNDKFQSQYDKDVLKNRYKHLRRLYNDVRKLLEHSGFSWDETREMITAEDNVWGAYTKEHPDARSYRVKTVPGYQKLCIIFGQENSDGRYSRLAHSADPNSEIPVLMIDDARVDPLRIDWEPAMDCHFVTLMLEQVDEGNMVGHTFSEQAWARMVESFKVKFGILFDKYILEDRYISLMKECDSINSLLAQSGFSWNETQRAVTAADAVWEEYIKVQPEVIAYRNTVLENYTDLCRIQSSYMLDKGLDNQDLHMQAGNNVVDVEIDGVPENIHFSLEEQQISEEQRKRPSTEQLDSGNCSKVQKVCQELQRADSEIADVTTSMNMNGSKNLGTIESAISALQSIPDMDDEFLLDACDLLEDDRKAKTFLALDSTLRKKWLLRKLRPRDTV